MAEIRLSKITKQFSIGLGKLVGFLNEHGIPAEMNPNAKISDEHLPLIEQHFGDDQKLKRDSELVTLKLKEIIEMGSKKKDGIQQTPTSAVDISTEEASTENSAAPETDSWKKIVKIHQDRRTVRGKVTRRYLHGVIVDIDGFEAKLPTHNLCDSEDELDSYIGQTLDLKVIRVFENNKSAVVSHRQPQNRDWSHDTAEKFDQPIICYVNWFNDQFGVVSPCTPLNTEKAGKANEIFIHCNCFGGDKHSIGTIEEQSLVLVSGIVKQTRKISATVWKKFEPAEDTIQQIAPFLGKVNPGAYGSNALSGSWIGKFLTKYLSNPASPFVNIFHTTFNGTPRERELLFRWLKVLRKGQAASKHPAYKDCIDNYLTRDEFYQGEVDPAEVTSLAVAGELPLSVLKPEYLKVPYSQVCTFRDRVIQEVDKNTTRFEECFKGIFDTLKTELESESNTLKNESNGAVLPVQIYSFSYSRSSSNIAVTNRKHILHICCRTITAYRNHSVLSTIDTQELTHNLLDFYRQCLNKSETMDARVEIRDMLETDDSFICSERDTIFEEALINNIDIDLLIKAVSSGKTTFNSWDRISGWEKITPTLAEHIICSPEKFPVEHVATIYNQVKKCGCLNKAYNLLNALNPLERDAELTQILSGLKKNFVLSDYESLLKEIDADMIEEGHIPDIKYIATEYYTPALISKVNSIAARRGSQWIKHAFEICSDIPEIIHSCVHITVYEHIKECIRKHATISDQFSAIQTGDLCCPEEWYELANIHTITTGDIDLLFNSTGRIFCNKHTTGLIPLIKKEKKYKEALYLAQKISNDCKQATDLEIYNETSYEEYIVLWLDGIGEQHDEALFANGLRYCASDSAVTPEGIYGIYEKCRQCLDKIEKDFNAEYRDAIIRLTLDYLSPSSCRNHFQTYLAIVKYIKSHDSDTNNGVSYQLQYNAKPQKIDIDLGNEDTNTDLKVALWFLDIGKKLSFTELKDYIVLFRPNQQQRVLKKVFHLFDKKGLTPNMFTIYNLFEAENALLQKIDDKDSEGLFDLSCRVVLYSLNKFAQTGSFEFEKDIFLEILMKQLTKNTKVKYKISGFFSKCAGRTKGKYRFENYNGILTQVPGGYSITFEVRGDDLQQLVTIIKTIPGRSYNSNTSAWFIPASEEQQIMLFARRYRIRIDFGSSNPYERNAHFIEPYRWENPPEIVREFCDGVPYGEIQARHKIPIVWCGSERCYLPCRKKHSEEEWENYTMLDFCRILGYNTDLSDRMGDIKKDGAYLMFVSWVNWFNMMLDHLYCNECGLILSPDRISSVGRYGVTEFSCRNEDCKEYRKSIYLNTCLNRNCRSVIDSRECKQCPNEWYICPTCGSCCSNDMIGRRYHALYDHGQHINTALMIAYAEKSGHMDSNTVFCYECGTQSELHDGRYYCPKCKRFIDYRNRQKRKV